jgi:hypothetical protein
MDEILEEGIRADNVRLSARPMSFVIASAENAPSALFLRNFIIWVQIRISLF